MRILHLADLHLGTELYGHYDAATGSSTRLSDFTRMLDIAVEDAIEKRADLFLFAGDAYKTRDPSPTQQRELAQRLRRLIDAEIPVFLLTGNHDMPNAMARATSLDIFGAFSPSNFIVANRPGAHKLQTRSGPLYVVAIPWLTRSVLLARDENKNLPQEDVHRLMLEKLDSALDFYLEQIPDDDTPAILALHGTIQGAEYSAERSTMLSQDLLIPRSVISRPRFSYVALGHIHKYQEVYSQPLTVYAGSPERIDFGEEKDDKGYVLVDLDRQGARHQFVKLPTRPFITFRIDCTGEDPTAQALEALQGKSVAGAIVRVRAQLSPANQGRLRETEIRQVLAEASFVVIRREVEAAWRDTQRGKQFSTAMTPREALSTYLDQEKAELLDDQKRKLLDWGDTLIAEVAGHGDESGEA
ncbi:MAG TPA: exonuclease SbcCD subunit D [Chloroflexota bacterium]|nr:exonuclease SbcCD subunit D [Chloroflexota bacterium]